MQPEPNMSTFNIAEERALQILAGAGADPQVTRRWLDALKAAGLRLADDHNDELICRWVNVEERPVPPDADTIIRTITRTTNEYSTSSTHWLDGLRGPRV
ncbi:MAG TPA: hypothetical protein VGL13_00720 [Polyangiaceae bacterium]